MKSHSVEMLLSMLFLEMLLSMLFLELKIFSCNFVSNLENFITSSQFVVVKI